MSIAPLACMPSVVSPAPGTFSGFPVRAVGPPDWFYSEGLEALAVAAAHSSRWGEQLEASAGLERTPSTVKHLRMFHTD